MYQEKIIYIDTETTGLDYTKDQIIELSAIKAYRQNKQEPEGFHAYIKCPRLLDSKISELTGISDYTLATQGKDEQKVMDAFVAFVGDGYSTLMVAYNAQFDLLFLKGALERCGYKGFIESLDYLDLLTVYRDRHYYPHKLKDAIAKYELKGYVNSHNASDDTRALLGVTKALIKERHDLHKYVNLFGYLEKYGVSGERLNKVTYLPQGKPTWGLYEKTGR